MARERKIGNVTLYAGRDGRWCGLSYPVGPSETFERLVRGEATAEEYVADVRQRVRDRCEASALIGKPAQPSGAEGEAPQQDRDT